MRIGLSHPPIKPKTNQKFEQPRKHGRFVQKQKEEVIAHAWGAFILLS